MTKPMKISVPDAAGGFDLLGQLLHKEGSRLHGAADIAQNSFFRKAGHLFGDLIHILREGITREDAEAEEERDEPQQSEKDRADLNNE